MDRFIRLAARLGGGCHVVFLLALGWWSIAPVQAADWLYTIRDGDTIWDLSERYLIEPGRWRELQRLNRVQFPRRLPPGQRLRFPVAWLKLREAPVRVVELQGTVQRLDGTPRPLRQGEILGPGAWLRTGADSNVGLLFTDDTRLLLQAGSELRLSRVSVYADSAIVVAEMHLDRGRLESQVVPRQHSATRYEITTPSAISAVRGTEYRLEADATDRQSRAEVLEGEIMVSAGGTTERVQAGFGTVVAPARPPEPPIPLLPAVDLAGLAARMTRLPVSLAMTPLAGAVGYRVQVAPDRRFDTLLMDVLSPDPVVRIGNLPDGDYWLRVRAIDGRGLEGRDNRMQFTIDARPEPPVIVSPTFQATVVEETPVFVWAERTGKSAYHFQLARDEAFTELLVDRPDLGDGRYTGPPLPPGNYYWRVATRLAGETGPFGDPQPFRRPRPGPLAQAPGQDGHLTVFRWSAGLPGEQYRFQLARDPNFYEVVLDTVVTEPEIRLPYLQSGIYYLRLGVIEQDGFIAPLGPIQQVRVLPQSYLPLAILPIIILLIAL